jgi:hypothetical protein
MRMRKIQMIATSVALLVLAAGCSEATSANGSAPSRPLQGLSVAQILQRSVKAAAASGSVHYVERSQETGSSVGTTTGDVSITSGRQVIDSGPSATVTTIFVDNVAYYNGTAAGLTDVGLGAQAAASAGKWVSVPSTDANYSSAVFLLTLHSVLGYVIPSVPLTSTGVTTVDGESVVGVKGGNSSSGRRGVMGELILYVSTRAPYLPVSEHASLRNGSVTGTDDWVFRDWGEKVNVSAPTGAS